VRKVSKGLIAEMLWAFWHIYRNPQGAE